MEAPSRKQRNLESSLDEKHGTAKGPRGDVPIYAAARDAYDRLVRKADTVTANAGLVFERFPAIWEVDDKKWTIKAKRDKEKTEPTEVVRFFSFVADLAYSPWRTEHFAEFNRRRCALLTARQAERLHAITSWRFVSGLGTSHPLENGFVWDRNLGVPYLSGSSVKGMIRAWAEQWEQVAQSRETELFGPAPHSAALEVGKIIVFDAYPTRPPLLEPDIMNPHYQQYYSDPTDKTPPADWLSPNPILFLTVAAGQQFEFAIAKRNAATATDDDLRDARGLLKRALEGLGAGAKTSSGYGYFEVVGEAPTVGRRAT